MVKLKNSILVNERLYSVFQALMNERMPYDASYKMKRFADKLDQKQKEHVLFMNELLKEHGELDESGNPVFEFEGEGENRRAVGYKLKDGAAFEAEMKKYLATEFEVEVTPLFAVELKNVMISPNDLTVLEPFIADSQNL
ncbi:MAG: hypothetical protein EBZ49_12195 [Proteobacteria bacterium]|nr:hypothetical protein [Pseudomonadota bacterium]